MTPHSTDGTEAPTVSEAAPTTEPAAGAGAPPAEVESRREDPAPAPAPLSDGFHRIDPGFVSANRLTGLVVTAIMGVGMLITAILVTTLATPRWVMAPALLLWLVAVTTLAWFSYSHPRWVYRRTSYRHDQEGIEIRKGILWRAVINIPRSRVQHTDVQQGPVMRRYGIAKLVIHTAGTQNATVDLDGLAHDTAMHLRNDLLPRDAPHAR